jgi:hypothetical protein
MYKTFSFILLLGMASQLIAGEARYSAANAITFSQSGNHKAFVGSGFLIAHGVKTYAVTAKHVLFETMNDGVNSVDVSQAVSQWQLRPFNEDTGDVTLGQLLNADEKEPIDMKVLSDDWLLFEVLHNASGLKVLTLSDQPLKSGEKISVHGCTYQTQSDCQQDSYIGDFVRYEDHNILVRLKDVAPNTLRGLSGAPVLNAKGEVMGIVSNVLPDEETGGMFFAPFSVQPLLDFLNQ